MVRLFTVCRQFVVSIAFFLKITKSFSEDKGFVLVLEFLFLYCII